MASRKAAPDPPAGPPDFQAGVVLREQARHSTWGLFRRQDHVYALRPGKAFTAKKLDNTDLTGTDQDVLLLDPNTGDLTVVNGESFAARFAPLTR